VKLIFKKKGGKMGKALHGIVARGDDFYSPEPVFEKQRGTVYYRAVFNIWECNSLSKMESFITLLSL
jgi:hypothetical protein